MPGVFEDYDFTPVQGDPFSGKAMPSRPVTPTPTTTYSPLQSDWIPTGSDVIPNDLLRSTPETLAGYAGNPVHPMGSRIGAGMVELARQYGLGLKNALETVMGPVYGQGHFPMASEGTEAGAPYAGAGLNLASQMMSPGGEGAVAAGWNPKALEYLKGLFKQKPPLKPETAEAVKKIIAGGTEYATQAAKTPGDPGAGIAVIAGTKHVGEEWAKIEMEQKEAALAQAAADKAAAAQAAAQAKAAAKAAAAKPQPPAAAPIPASTTPAAAPAAAGGVYPGLKDANGWSPKAYEYMKKEGVPFGAATPQDVGGSLATYDLSNPNDQKWLIAYHHHQTEMNSPAPTAAPVSLAPTAAPVSAAPAMSGATPSPLTAKMKVGDEWSPEASKHLQDNGLSPVFKTPNETHAEVTNDPYYGSYQSDKLWHEALVKHHAEMGNPPPPNPFSTPTAPTPAPAPVTAPAAGGTVITPKGTKKAKTPKAASTVPMSPQQALGLAPPPVDPAMEAKFNKLFTQYVPPLKVPTMKPFDPTKGMPEVLAHETAPGTSGVQTPFNPDGLPMDKDSVRKRMEDLGFGPIGGNWLFWRGISPHGPYSWDSAAMGYRSPGTKTNEPGLFMAPDANAAGKPGKPIAQMYGANVNAHVIRSENPLVVDYKKASGSSHYSSAGMQKAIKDAWNKGHDTVLFKDIHDIGGKHDQMVVKDSNQLRHPGAAFNPKYKDLPNLLATGGLGYEVPPIVAHEQEIQQEQGNE